MAATDDYVKEAMIALQARLDGDATLQAFFSGGNVPVGEHIRANQAFPYIEISHIRTDTEDTDGEKVFNVRLAVSFYTEETTSKNMRDWARRVFILLEDQTFTVTGYNLSLVKLIGEQSGRDRSGRVYVCRQQYLFALTTSSSGILGAQSQISIGDGGSPEAFSLLTGGTVKRMEFTLAPIDETDILSPSSWREFIESDGEKRLRIRAELNISDTTNVERVRSAAFSGAFISVQFNIPTIGVFEGSFLVTYLDAIARTTGFTKLNLLFASSGLITFTAS